MTHAHRVLIVGGGFGGLHAAKALRRAPVEVTLVDRANHHLFQPLLYQVATAILTEGEIAPPLRGVLRRQANARVLLADVRGFDLDARIAHATAPDGEELELGYDSLIVAAGATGGLKTLDDAREIRSQVLRVIGRSRAVGTAFGIRFTGRLALFIWAVVHVRHLVGWGNRLVTMTRWLWSLLARDRGQRVISPTPLTELSNTAPRTRVTI